MVITFFDDDDAIEIFGIWIILPEIAVGLTSSKVHFQVFLNHTVSDLLHMSQFFTWEKFTLNRGEVLI